MSDLSVEKALAGLAYSHPQFAPLVNRVLTALSARTRELEEITAAALEVCPDGGDPDLPRFVCVGESGDPIIETETVAEVIHGMSRCWAATQERAEKAERELEEMRAEHENDVREFQELSDNYSACVMKIAAIEKWVREGPARHSICTEDDGQYYAYDIARELGDETVAAATTLLELGKLLREREGK